MIRIALLQDLRRMKFSEYYARTKARKLTQIEAASLPMVPPLLRQLHTQLT